MSNTISVQSIYEPYPIQREKFALSNENRRKIKSELVKVRVLTWFVMTKDDQFVWPQYRSCTPEFWKGVSVYGFMACPVGASRWHIMAGFWDEDWGGKHFEAVRIKHVYGISKEKNFAWRSGEETALWLESEQGFSYVLMEPADVFAEGWAKVVRSWAKINGDVDDPTFRPVDLKSPRAHWWSAAGDKAWEWMVSERRRNQRLGHGAEDMEIGDSEGAGEGRGEGKRKRQEMKVKGKEAAGEKGRARKAGKGTQKVKEKRGEKLSEEEDPAAEGRRSETSQDNCARAVQKSKKRKVDSDVVSSPRAAARSKSNEQPWYSITDSDREYLAGACRGESSDSSLPTCARKTPDTSVKRPTIPQEQVGTEGGEAEMEWSPHDSATDAVDAMLKRPGRKSLQLSEDGISRSNPQGRASSAPAMPPAPSVRVVARSEGVDEAHTSRTSFEHGLREPTPPPQRGEATIGLARISIHPPSAGPVSACPVASHEGMEPSASSQLAHKVQGMFIAPESEPTSVSGAVALVDPAVGMVEVPSASRVNPTPDVSHTSMAPKGVVSVASAPRGEVDALSTIAERDQVVTSTALPEASAPLAAPANLAPRAALAPPPPHALPVATSRMNHSVLAIGTAGSDLSDLDGRCSRRHMRGPGTTSAQRGLQ